MKIEVNQYQPELIRRFKRKLIIGGHWWEHYNGFQLFGLKILGISLQRSVVLSDYPFDYRYDNLSIWIHLLSWPINIDIRWNKRPSNFGNLLERKKSPSSTKKENG